MLNIYWLPTGFSSCYWRKCLFKRKKIPDILICQSGDFSDLRSVTFFCHQWPGLAGLLSWQVLHACKHICPQMCQQALVTQRRLIPSSHWVQHNSLGPRISIPFKHHTEHGCSVGSHSKATQLLTKLKALLNSSSWGNDLLYQLCGIYFYFYLLNTGGMKEVSNPRVFCSSVQAVL